MSRVPPVVPLDDAKVTASSAACHCATVAVPLPENSDSACELGL